MMPFNEKLILSSGDLNQYDALYFIYKSVQAFSFIGVVLKSAETGNSLQRCLNVILAVGSCWLGIGSIFRQGKFKSKKFIYPAGFWEYTGKLKYQACLRPMSEGEWSRVWGLLDWLLDWNMLLAFDNRLYRPANDNYAKNCYWKILKFLHKKTHK